MGEWLRRPIAGIPAWGWALVIAGTIAGYAYLQQWRGGGAPRPAPETLPYPDGQSPADAGDIPGTPTVPDRDVPVTTNPAWIRVVTDRMVADSYSPVEVGNALTKALGGLEITAAEAALWNIAVRRFGAPPEGHPPLVVKPGPTAPNPSTPKPTPKPKAPAIPTGLRILRADRMQIEVAWNAVAGATSYRVTRTPGAGIFAMVGTRQLIGPLPPGTRFGFRVMAVGPGGQSAWSGTVYGTTKK